MHLHLDAEKPVSADPRFGSAVRLPRSRPCQPVTPCQSGVATWNLDLRPPSCPLGLAASILNAAPIGPPRTSEKPRFVKEPATRTSELSYAPRLDLIRLSRLPPGEDAGQRHASVEAADLAAKSVRPQQVAHAAARPDDAQRDAVRRELAVQLVQHA